jgi:hypothetical protein
MNDLDLALLIFLEDEQSSEDETERWQASDVFKRRATEVWDFQLMQRTSNLLKRHC